MRVKDMIKNIKFQGENDKRKKEGASVDLEGEDFYKSTPIVTNYYFQHKR